MKILKSFSYAWSGLKYCFTTQTNFKIHLFFAALAILLSLNFHVSILEWLIILLCMMSVLCIEMVNTAIEKLCDVAQTEFHPGIKTVKDISAGAVLVSAMISFIIGGIIFIPKIIISLNLGK